MKLLALTRYSRVGPSSRLRFFQFIPHLKAAGISVQVEPLVGDGYIHRLFSFGKRPLSLLWQGYLHRIRMLAKINQFDLVWIEKELFPWLPVIEEWLLSGLGKPYVVDFDDAVYHLYDQHKNRVVRAILGKKLDSVMRHAQVVTVGNKYLAERAEKAGSGRVRTIPTVVDMQRYKAIPRTKQDFTVGWIGSPNTEKFLEIIRPALEMLTKEEGLRIVLVGASGAALQGMAPELVPWTEDTEVNSINRFDVGIMPLSDDPFTRGKCGYKLIQCMACGVPVVASPVGTNKNIVDHGENGFLAETQAEWVSCLRMLRNEKKMREKMGQNARAKIMVDYSLAKAAPAFCRVLFDAARR